ncbi:hypothetical protein LINGRAHAP2_LOCUS32567 [Linum grandiflorum]
MTPLSF